MQKCVGHVLRVMASFAAAAIASLLGLAFLIVASEVDDPRPSLLLAWIIGIAAFCVAVFLVVRSPSDGRSLGLSYALIAIALVASWELQSIGLSRGALARSR